MQQNKTIILRQLTDCLEPINPASYRLMEKLGLPFPNDYLDLVEANIAAGRENACILIDAPLSESIAEAWNEAFHLAQTLNENVSLYNKSQWQAEYGYDSVGATFRIQGHPSDYYIKRLQESIDKFDMVVRKDSVGTYVSFVDDDGHMVGESFESRNFVERVSPSLCGAMLGFDDVVDAHLEKGPDGYAVAFEDASGDSWRDLVSEGDAGLLKLANSNPSVVDLIFSTTESYLVEAKKEKEDKEKSSIKLDILTVNSPKTRKGEKVKTAEAPNGYLTGVLYVAPFKSGDATGRRNVCTSASGQIAQQYCQMIEAGTSIEDMRDQASDQVTKFKERENELEKKKNRSDKDEDNLRKAKKNRRESEEILKHINTVLMREDSPKTLKALLGKIGCVGACLGNNSGRGTMDSTKKQRAAKTERIYGSGQEEAIEVINNDIRRLVKRASEDKMKPTVRLNGTSDTKWVSDERFFVDGGDGKKISLIELWGREGVPFYDYTKHMSVMRRYLNGDFPKNYHLTFSFGGNNWEDCQEVLRKKGNVSMAFRLEDKEPLPLTVNGFKVVDGDESDLRGLDEDGVIVGLHSKGMTKSFVTDFIVSPTGNKFDIEWPEDSKYRDMSDEEKKKGQESSEEKFYNKIKTDDARLRYRSTVIDEIKSSKSNWEKYVGKGYKKVLKDLKDGSFNYGNDYISMFSYGLRQAFRDMFDKAEDDAKKILGSSKSMRDDDSKYIALKIIGMIQGKNEPPDFIETFKKLTTKEAKNKKNKNVKKSFIANPVSEETSLKLFVARGW